MNCLKFEWDEVKESKNQKKYNISFEEATTVLNDSFGRLIPDPEHSESEERYIHYGNEFKIQTFISLPL